MARPVPLKYVVSFSSQDDTHSVQNLLKDGSFKKWLSDPKDRTGTMEAVIQLEKSCIISYLDIGSHWCSNISVLVGKSEWPQSRQFEPLIRNTCLMTLADVQLGRNTTNTKMFNTSDFSSSAAANMWDRIRVVCQQNFRKNIQFGLTFLRIKASKIEDSSVDLTDQLSKGREIKCEKNSKSMHEKIQSHFFKGTKLKSPESNKHLETELLKIASTSDNGTDRVEGLSRTAHILKAAQGNAGKYAPSKYLKPSPKPSGKKSFFAELISHNQKPLIKDGKAEENINSKQKTVQNSFSKGNQAKSPVASHHMNSTDQLEGLSRTAQMLMMAEENAGKYAPSKRYEPSPKSSRKSLFFSEMKAQKESLPIQEEIDAFLSKLEIKPEDLESITIADLRHKFEKKKKRKLNKEERKLYVDKVSDHINAIFSQASQSQDEISEERQQTKRKRVEPPTTEPHGRHFQKSPKKKCPNSNQQSLPPKENRKRKVIEYFNDTSEESDDDKSVIVSDPKISHERRRLTESCIESTPSKTYRLKDTIANPREVTTISRVTSPGSPTENDIQFDLELEDENAACPLCGEIFPLDVIEVHANVCADSQQFDLHYL